MSKITNDITENTNITSEEISLKELIYKIQGWWSFLVSKWRVILITGAIGGALRFTYSF